uniref:CMP/dCMP-type deaminase domain-containing protein n=1 Tax=Dunaliella tertiolecta TaxID=3047 RepID=A0A7S3QWS1_DUNTE|mmetsp:Transcript_23828/g.65479  ORF Transcript_23828/g.65479 Transcript_23828/m.65479 type:complete len:368 (+) Transcript_23828:107-1210(+)|eukprot:CAMPEP_0202350806 /NCGR_PEP_ID=MMETSP1126-20121109/7729_1 /ASSEMBLY_ACC=CAM_ASM_000457 /TAXON_ID=3047 /ORGANISM="Dunaliella tertiolecta, Strain CCMP1320" /LENGTH=367 /DNA_ID=CAMNT_0048942847 /DNA_START=1121 /DNA_END=2224 /DNA_ORIENTATION=+
MGSSLDFEPPDVSDGEGEHLKPHLKSGGSTKPLADTGVLRQRFMIPPTEVEELLAARHIAKHDSHAVHAFLMSLVQPAACLARAPISSFHVGAVGLGVSGAIYVGVNIEFPHGHLNDSIHAEQFLLLNCLNHGERGLQVLAVSAAPCGHCRQFMVETTTADHARIVFGAEEDQPCCSGKDASSEGVSNSSLNGGASKVYNSYNLNDLLPLKFGPMDLMSDGKAFPLLLAQQHHKVSVSPRSLAGLAAKRGGISEFLDRGIKEAERWAQQCYAPYTECVSGVAILTSEGKVYSGGYVESAAFNPSLTPFHAAWAAAVSDHVLPEQVQEVILTELHSSLVSQRHGVKSLTKKLAPQASFTLLYLQQNSV